jgi:hypothetical protein
MSLPGGPGEPGTPGGPVLAHALCQLQQNHALLYYMRHAVALEAARNQPTYIYTMRVKMHVQILMNFTTDLVEVMTTYVLYFKLEHVYTYSYILSHAHVCQDSAEQSKDFAENLFLEYFGFQPVIFSS